MQSCLVKLVVHFSLFSLLFLGRSVSDRSGVCVQVGGGRVETGHGDREIFQSGVPAQPLARCCVSYGPRRRQSLVPAGVEITI